MSDPFNSSSPDISFEEPLIPNSSEVDLGTLQIETETWNLYGNSTKESPLPQDPTLSPWNRNFASSNLSLVSIPESDRNLEKRSEVRRAPRRQNHSSPALPLPQRTTYSAFPKCTPSTPPTANTSRSSPDFQSNDHPTDPQNGLHNSWPTRAASRSSTPPRTRARTTSSTPPVFAPPCPSNLSTCTTLDYQSSRDSSPCPSSSPLYMHHLPSRSFVDLEKRGRCGGRGGGLSMELGNETSAWEEDDDEEGVGGLVGSLRSKVSKLHIRSSSAQEEGAGELEVKVRQGKKVKRSLSEVVKGVFRGRRKGGTL